MSSHQPPKRHSKVASPKSILHFESSDPAHFEKWRQAVTTEASKLFGKLSNIFITNQYPEETPLPEAPDEPLNDENDPGAIQREYIKQLISDKVRDDRKTREDKPKLFGFLINKLSHP